MSDQNIELSEKKISELQPFENRFRLTFKVIDKSEAREVTSRNNPSESHRISDITVADDTGSIILSAWDDDIDFLESEKFFVIENGYVNIFRDSMRLSRGKFGNFEAIDDEFDVSVDPNRSEEVHERYPNRGNYNRRGNYGGNRGDGGYHNENRNRERRLRF